MSVADNGRRSLRIALVLGSGGARGYAHIGVIRELERRGHKVVSVAGASMGAVIGGMYAAGGLDEFAEFVSSLTLAEVARFADVSLGGPGVLSGERITRRMHEIVGDVRFEDLNVPTTVVATDIINQREVWFQNGLLLPAVRASFAIPAAFIPVSIGGRVLADGGLLNPLPVDAALAIPADAIVGVSLFGRNATLGSAAPTRETADEAVELSWSDRLAETFMASSLGRRLAIRSQPAPALSFEPLPTDLTSRDMLTRAIDTMSASIETSRIAATPPDVLISVPCDAAGTFEFHRGNELIELGRALAVEAFDEVEI